MAPRASRSLFDPSTADRAAVDWDRGGDSVGGEEAPRVAEAPASLRDTEPDGALTVDANGRFVADAEARAFFDYFLTAAGELDPSALRALLVTEIEARLPAAAAREAVVVLDDYLEWRRRARRFAESGEVPADLGERLKRISELRREVLGDDLAEAFFGTEEKVLEADLARREILARNDLGAAERERLLWEADRALPEPVREARRQALVPMRLGEDEAALRAAGGSDEEIRQLREQTVGAAAADRLEALDRERAEWDRRVAAYLEAREAIERDRSLDDGARAERIDRLLQREFSETERLRVTALERMR